ncbi:hypothetical protein [Colwellia psychrerythraea]|uniref:Swiss Army Knife 2H phosphoesterase domain-containing protein n=1 Tax=Colwellia psychrerythraea TaxID=28229 RepID=A0A099KQG0_COLPS|nr:hypothetical protein [Colwellia psychrerythraea]KGJ92721.1 hypothetical protein ND2E_2969 [Colwellia psychrerythraea]
MNEINKVTILKVFLFTFIICWQASLSAKTINKFLAENTNNHPKEAPMSDTPLAIQKALVIQLEVIKLTDNSGLTYIGGKVSEDDLERYLCQMQKILGDDFTRYRQYQSERDLHTFHMTLINPYEYQSVTKDVAIGTILSVSLRGLGRVSRKDKTTYFVVAQSSLATKYRQNLRLPDKDFHVTLGFYPSDIYGVNKGVTTLIK